MTASVNILRGDLHLALSTAFNRGRYVLMTGGDGQPQEITIDLRERDDDLFESEPLTDKERAALAGRWARGDFSADDHGPAIPAQDWTDTPPEVSYASPFVSGPVVYEFALQDCERLDWEIRDGVFPPLDTIRDIDAPDQDAVKRADWVHVYDRVTRERRTLKRPEPDAVLKGLRDVAADLRAKATGYPFDQPGVTVVRGAPVEPPFGCAALPPVGPLTSTEGLLAGDVLLCIDDAGQPLLFGHSGKIYTLRGVMGDGVLVDTEQSPYMPNDHRRFAFVGRPDADGWMTWAGGENPVPGVWVEARTFSKGDFTGKSEGMEWGDIGESGYQMVAFRIVDTAPAV